MKRFLTFLCAVTLVLGMVGSASAVTLYENFYGGSYDSNRVDIWQGDSVTLGFDLTQVNTATPLPTTDESSYNSSTMQIIDAALDFTFSSKDSHCCDYDDNVTINAGYYDGNNLIAYKDYDLGYSYYWNWGVHHVRQYATLHIDLSPWLSYLQDGAFDTIVLAVNNNVCYQDNDFTLDQGSLTASAVPEPATILLMGIGLLGMAGYSRKRKNS